jgi:CO/xanthine dehydrogenase FAD-binding subunit
VSEYPYLKRLPPFEYLAPRSLAEAGRLLRQHAGQAAVLAGGTDLLLHMKERKTAPAYLIGLKSIPDLDYLLWDPRGGLSIGPLATVHSLEISPLVKERYPILKQAAAVLGSLQVRNLATVAGNLCSALPSADMAPALVVLGARLRVKGGGRQRSIAVEDFFLAPGKCALDPGELLSEVRVPAPPANSGMVYLKHMTRSAMDLSIVGVAALIGFEKGRCKTVRICLGTAGPRPLRASRAEAVLSGQKLDSSLIQQAAAIAARDAQVRSSQRASEEYRREIIKTLTNRALRQISEKAA